MLFFGSGNGSEQFIKDAKLVRPSEDVIYKGRWCERITAIIKAGFWNK